MINHNSIFFYQKPGEMSNKTRGLQAQTVDFPQLKNTATIGGEPKLLVYWYTGNREVAMTVSASDKRGFIRVPFNTEVEVRVEGRTIRSREGIDLSMSGIRLTIGDEPPVACTSCQVKIILQALESGPHIEASGRVIRSAPGSLAIKFEELDLDSYHHLRQLILNNANDPETAEKEFTAHWGIRPLRP